jgi:hypothetical protein
MPKKIYVNNYDYSVKNSKIKKSWLNEGVTA